MEQKRENNGAGMPCENTALLLRESGISYTASGILPVLVSMLFLFVAAAIGGEGYESAQWYKYCSYLLPQLCFAACCFLFLFRTKQPFRTVASGCKWQYFLVAVLLQFGLLSLSELNGYFLKFLELFGYKQPAMNLPDVTGWNLLPALLVIALMPALCEEFLFRGVIVGTMRRSGWGTAAIVIVSGALFSLFHTNPAQTVYQFICGMCFALIALRSGSIFPTVLSHFLNNALVLTMYSFGLNDFPQEIKLPLYVVSAVCLIASLVYLVFFDKSNGQKGGVKHAKSFFLGAGVGIFICAVSWIIVFVQGVS